jgi:hypothetical protein
VGAGEGRRAKVTRELTKKLGEGSSGSREREKGEGNKRINQDVGRRE